MLRSILCPGLLADTPSFASVGLDDAIKAGIAANARILVNLLMVASHLGETNNTDLPQWVPSK
jgi:hypothetical protein